MNGVGDFEGTYGEGEVGGAVKLGVVVEGS
jgi:hypothetical protein